MTPEEKAKFDNIYELTRENNDILRNMQRRGRLSFALRIFYWTLIIGISIGAFYFIQPYVDAIRGIAGGTNTTSSPGYAETLQDLLR